MGRMLLILTLCSVALLAAKGKGSSRSSGYQDRDMDGVVDRYDRCPNTPFFALVDRRGCTVKKLRVAAPSGKPRPMAGRR